VPVAAIAPHIQNQAVGERVHAAHAHAVQTARDLVGVRVKLAACMQHGEHHFGCRATQLWVHAHGYSSAIVLNRTTAVGVQNDRNLRAVACQGLIDGVVDDLVDQMMQSADVGVPDVHPWPHAYGL